MKILLKDEREMVGREREGEREIRGREGERERRRREGEGLERPLKPWPGRGRKRADPEVNEAGSGV